ncbi:hypothetical protein SS50377_20998 [Spironucleus salmonicida]|uniref:Uncharacterized protein n=1 Tax=Spironucleus salmonicida TaxID=348837 RepID=V6LGK9_9EUKA|nr:hypothetical protein SS50377_20998 [Spironucleus salmonicida]|eukprot:EST43665.1 Hypothetical protein SS50377_16708 [Spironucleus salmonicida]
MDKIFRAFDAKEYENSLMLIEKLVLSAKNEGQKAQFNSLKAYAHVNLGQYAYARQCIDPQKFALQTVSSQLDILTLPQLNFLYLINFDQTLQFANFDSQKLEPIEKSINSYKTKSKNEAVSIRENLSICFSQNFIKMCKRQSAQIDAILNESKIFIELLVRQNIQNADMKNVNINGQIGDRIHRDHGIQILNNIFMFLGMILCNKSVEPGQIVRFVKEMFDKEFVTKSIAQTTPRLHLLLTCFIQNPQEHRKLILENLIVAFNKTGFIDFVDPIINFSATYEEVTVKLISKISFWGKFITFVLTKNPQQSDILSIITSASTSIEQLQAVYNFIIKSTITVPIDICLFTKIFSILTVEEIIEVLDRQNNHFQEVDSLLKSAILLNYSTTGKIELLRDKADKIEVIIQQLQENYSHNAFSLKVAYQIFYKETQYKLAQNYLAQIQVAHNLYLTSAPHVYDTIFTSVFNNSQKLSQLVFKPTYLINHTDEQSIVDFPQLIIGACLYKSEQCYEIANNSFDALINAANPYGAARLLESKSSFQLSYSRIFSDSILSTYNFIFASKNQLQKPNLLFEGVCGNEMGTSPNAGTIIFSQNNEIVSQSSLYFYENKTFTQQVNIPIFNAEKPKQPIKSLQKYDICKFSSEFGQSFSQLFVPEVGKYIGTQFGLLATFTTCIIRTCFNEITVKSEPIISYLVDLMKLDIIYVSITFKYFISQVLLGVICGQEIETTQVDFKLQTSGFDFFIAGPICEFLFKIAEIKKLNCKELREQFKLCYKVE